MPRLGNLLIVGLVLVGIMAPAPTALADSSRHGAGDDIVLEVGPLEGLAPLDAITVRFDDAYDADPMGLVAYLPFTSLFTGGEETWDVWICRPTGEALLGLDLNEVVSALNGTTADYFETISEGRYRPVFRGRGSSSDAGCGIRQTHTGTTPRMYVNDFTVLADSRSEAVGQGAPGTISWSPDAMIYEGLQRRAEIDGAAVAEVSAYEYSPAASIAAHEIGHTVHWAHSGAVDNYDNELDVMSLGWGGTHGFNLYSAGWIEPSQVSLHVGGDRSYTIGPIGYAGTRLVILTTASQGHFYALSVRNPAEPILDANSEPLVEAPGLEVYRIDQRPGSCTPLPDASPCFGIVADVSPYPKVPASFPGPYAHFHTAGESFQVEGVEITATDAGSGRLDLAIEGGITASGWFVDDDDSVFEADIEWAAVAGITLGCNPPRGDRFCPDDAVSRGQMAAFLVRALDLPASGIDAFSDDEKSVFEADINALAASGITRGCKPTSFCPDDPVTRGQMAAFLSRAYRLVPSAEDAFSDDADSVFQADINALAASGITRGCTPTSFCPADLVTRGQMAAFLRRATDL
jgi:hypothetical protein